MPQLDWARRYRYEAGAILEFYAERTPLWWDVPSENEPALLYRRPGPLIAQDYADLYTRSFGYRIVPLDGQFMAITLDLTEDRRHEKSWHLYCHEVTVSGDWPARGAAPITEQPLRFNVGAIVGRHDMPDTAPAIERVLPQEHWPSVVYTEDPSTPHELHFADPRLELAIANAALSAIARMLGDNPELFEDPDVVRCLRSWRALEQDCCQLIDGYESGLLLPSQGRPSEDPAEMCRAIMRWVQTRHQEGTLRVKLEIETDRAVEAGTVTVSGLARYLGVQRSTVQSWMKTTPQQRAAKEAMALHRAELNRFPNEWIGLLHNGKRFIQITPGLRTGDQIRAELFNVLDRHAQSVSGPNTEQYITEARARIETATQDELWAFYRYQWGRIRRSEPAEQGLGVP
ncbi:DNA-packaging protein [Mycobacteroides abscessus]|uniref:DNA-packaging protein n=1 Tax=Mycobacteroides abscessus TaxID=36809 RepID=UPI002105584E|nr:DNA-packaging protein [Mycobacteroides abscessus]